MGHMEELERGSAYNYFIFDIFKCFFLSLRCRKTLSDPARRDGGATLPQNSHKYTLIF